MQCLQLYVHWDYKFVKSCTEKYLKKYITVIVDELECDS